MAASNSLDNFRTRRTDNGSQLDNMKTISTTIACLVFALIIPLEAKTIKFPEDDPVFRFKLPDGWTMEADKDGDMVCKSDDEPGITLNVNKMNQTFAQVKKSLPDLGKTFTQAAKMTGIETKDLGDDTNKQGVKGTIYVVKGKSSGQGVTAELLAIEPKPGEDAFFIMFSGLATAMSKHGEDIGAIIDSIKPIE
jgi:hypothetical protein